ncbi:MAG: glycosyltransferase family 4 protein, partial [Nanoarchaeota archaeon]
MVILGKTAAHVKMLVTSAKFKPAFGGIPTVVDLLASEYARAGHDVTVLTVTPGSREDGGSYRVVESARAVDAMRLIRWCDVLVQNGPALRTAWPLFILNRPWIIIHHSLAYRIPWAKLFASRHAHHISVSRAMADLLPFPTAIIPNPYDDRVFCVDRDVRADNDLIFVGRLSSEKGVDVLLRALSLLHEGGDRITLTIVGDGPKAAELKHLGGALGVLASVRFVGRREPAEIARLLRCHRVAVAPSRFETFGVAVLEALACGCAVVGSRSGGIPEALGECGELAAPGDPVALA